MTKKEFVRTITVCGQKIDIGIDDYGQCYFIEWDDSEGHHEMGLGAYNFNYIEPIYSMFDNKFNTLLRKHMLDEPMTDEEKNDYEEYQNLFRKEGERCRFDVVL